MILCVRARARAPSFNVGYISVSDCVRSTMYHLGVTLALCLTGLLATSLAQETDYKEQTIAVLEGDQRNVSDILKQSLSRHRRGVYSSEHFKFVIMTYVMMHESMHRFDRPTV